MPLPRPILRLLPAALAAGLLAVPARPQGYPPEKAAARMTTPDGFRVELVAAEPLVRQPVAIDFDERGRLWVMQYLQYPNPEGLKRVKVDRYSRTVYDRVPDPPPKGPKGADRLTVLSDPGADGRFRKSKDFLNRLNLGSAFAFGHGGVFVLQTPYLLFYPDRDRDDVPDSDPDVLLAGFGMEDAHSVANSLTWGPDGWLYGCQGSTVTARIRNPADPDAPPVEFQQGVWRYHPITHRFELFCEGGGNSWGLDFDRYGNLLYSTNFGGFVALHGVQGGYYWKSFGKHGALHNPHAYGYFDHVPHRNFKGGHVTVGGIIYSGDAYPESFRGKYVAADLLGHGVYWHDLEAFGSSFRSRHGGELLVANDTWFAPSDVALGPDGCVYVADWHDKRTAHPDPDAEWDRSNGRIYRVAYKNAPRPKPFDLAKLPSDELVKLLSHPNGWYARTARRVLADRRDPEVILPLRARVFESKDDALALQYLWALHVSGGFDEAFGVKCLGHRSPHVRRWAVRLLGDEVRLSAETCRKLAELAAAEPDVSVRSQLASTAKRLPADAALPIIRAIVVRDLDRNDPHVPLLLWWAVEKHCVAARGPVTDFFASAKAWKAALAREAVLGRLVRRYAAEGPEPGLAACAHLLASASSLTERQRLLAALDQGLQERPGNVAEGPYPEALRKLLGDWWQASPADPTLLRLLLRSGDPAARAKALVIVRDRKAPAETRLALLPVLAETGPPAMADLLLGMIGGGDPEAIQLAALAALQRFDGDPVASALLAKYPKLPARLKARTRTVLFGRKGWALAFLRGVDAGKFAAKEVTLDELRALAPHGDRTLDALVRKHWGNVQGGTPEERLAEVRRLNNDLRAGTGDAKTGREIFAKRCAACHKLFGEGAALGPDLTHANRADRDYLLVSIVDPSAVIRKEHLAYTIHTDDGLVLTGLIAEQTPERITLVNAKNERIPVPRNRIESLRESPVSLMPDNLLKDLKPQELRDLFRYLQSK